MIVWMIFDSKLLSSIFKFSFKFIIVSCDSTIKQKQYWEPLRNKETNFQWKSE